MEFTATEGSGSYERPKAGSYAGVIVGFVHAGKHASKFGEKPRVVLLWELHRRNGPSKDANGNIHTVTSFYNASFGDSSSLRPVIEACFGKFKPGQKTSSQSWLGGMAKLTLADSDDGKYTNIKVVAPLDPEEDVIPNQVLQPIHWEIEDGRKGIAPPPWAKWLVQRSVEWPDFCEKVGGMSTDAAAKEAFDKPPIKPKNGKQQKTAFDEFEDAPPF